MENAQTLVSRREVAGPRSPAVGHDQPQPAGDVTVVIALSNEVTRRGIVAMLQPMPMVSSVRPVSDGPGAAAELSRNRSELVIASTEMSPPDYTLLREQSRAALAQALLILPSTGHPHIQRAMSYEAEGYLLEQDVTAPALQDAVQRIVASETILSNRLARTMLTSAQSSARTGGRAALTRQERQILQLLVDGLRNKQIAARLGISQHAAKRHVANIIFKLDCANRTQAAALALREGLLS